MSGSGAVQMHDELERDGNSSTAGTRQKYEHTGNEKRKTKRWTRSGAEAAVNRPDAGVALTRKRRRHTVMHSVSPSMSSPCGSQSAFQSVTSKQPCSAS